MSSILKTNLLKITGATNCEEIEIIQPLWSGYGKISRYKLTGAVVSSVVVKHISLSAPNNHPRGWNTDKSHQRKIKSYQVETAWYQKWSSRTNIDCRIPQFLGSFKSENANWIVMEDLQTDFPLVKQQINLTEIKVVLKWLANFHGTFLKQEPTNLWEIGTYWNISTRPDEFEKMETSKLKVKAHLIDEVLNSCNYKTIVHGDAKLANFCFSLDSNKVAAVDFQYVGGGCGIKDVAYFLGSCLSSQENELYEQELLSYYFNILHQNLQNTRFNFQELEQEWRATYPFACADFIRFLMGWSSEHPKNNAYNQNKVKEVLALLN